MLKHSKLWIECLAVGVETSVQFLFFCAGKRRNRPRLGDGWPWGWSSRSPRTAIAPSWHDIGQLAAIAVLRTALNFFLEREIDHEERRLIGRQS
jgi:hypothetical protein